MYELDADTRLTPAGEGAYTGEVTDRWNIDPAPNGGYVMCFAMRALGDVLPQPDPLTATMHFLRPASPGPLEVRTEVIKTGRTTATGAAVLLQGGKEIARCLATFGDLARARGPTHIDGTPPALPPRPQCLAGARDLPLPVFAQRFDNYFDPATVGWARGAPSGEPVIRAWQRFADGREPDTLALPVFADGLPPPIFDVIPTTWVPTLELTLHVRARPAAGWLRGQFRTRFLFGGFLEEDGELWDDTGTLVALSRQHAAVLR